MLFSGPTQEYLDLMTEAKVEEDLHKGMRLYVGGKLFEMIRQSSTKDFSKDNFVEAVKSYYTDHGNHWDENMRNGTE